MIAFKLYFNVGLSFNGSLAYGDGAHRGGITNGKARKLGDPALESSAVVGALVDLRILATTDLHMHLVPDETCAGLSSQHPGFSGAAASIRSARGEAKNFILVDNGDFLHGSPMGDALAQDYLRGRREQRAMHPIVAAMHALRYDVVNLGNHDFDFGAEYLGQVLKNASFAVVSSNMRLIGPSAPDAPRPLAFAEPFHLLDRTVVDRNGTAHDLRIGFLGLMPPGSLTGLRGGVFSAEIRDIVETAWSMVPQLRALGADIVVVLAHSGLGEPHHRHGMENAVVPLAEVPGVDAIIAGHDHQVFPRSELSAESSDPIDPVLGRVHGTPVVSPGFWGSHIGIIDLALGQDADGNWHVVSSRCEACLVETGKGAGSKGSAASAPSRRLRRTLEPYREVLEAESQRIIGETHRRLHTFFAPVAPSAAIDTVHRAMLRFAPQADLPTDLPILASAAPFSVGGRHGPDNYIDILPGPITGRELADLYRFPNHLSALRLTGAELRDWLERATAVFNRIEPGKGDQPMMNPDVPGYVFESVAGCEYSIDLTKPAGRKEGEPSTGRIRDLAINGIPLGSTDEVLLLTNSFRVSGGGSFPIPQDASRVYESDVGIRQILADYLVSEGPYKGPILANWRFSPVPCARGVFASSPKGSDVIAKDELGGIVAGEMREDGFKDFFVAL